MNSQQQRQQQLHKLSQQQQEQQFYIFEDLKNVMGILAETNITLKLFSSNLNHPYVTLAKNRLILQINLSNGIQWDQTKTFQNSQNDIAFIKQQKREAKVLFDETIKSINPSDPEINELINFYLQNNLNETPNCKQLKSYPSQVQAQFNQKTVSKVIGGMQETDAKLSNIYQGKQYHIPTKADIEEMIQKRTANAEAKLKENFKSDLEQSQVQIQVQQDQLNQESLEQKQVQQDQDERKRQEKRNNREEQASLIKVKVDTENLKKEDKIEQKEEGNDFK